MEDLDALFAILDRFSQTKLLVVGDMMLDRFIWGKVSRISPEAPVPVVQVTRESAHLGGAANVVCNLESLGAKAIPIGLIGTDGPAADFLGLLKASDIDDRGMVRDESFESIQETRIIAQRQQVCRVDRERKTSLTPEQETKVQTRLFELLEEADAVIVSDYGKGVITRHLLQNLMQRADKRIISVDPKDKNYDYYHDVTVITPNQNEAQGMSGVGIEDEQGLRKAASVIFEKLHCKRLLITLGERGMALFRSPTDMVLIPTQAHEVFDVSGAGDTVIATYTLAKAAGATPRQAAILANAAAGVVVGKFGTATLNRQELREALKRWQKLEAERGETGFFAAKG